MKKSVRYNERSIPHCVVVTTCTGRKRADPEISLSAHNLPTGSLEFLGKEWRERISEAKPSGQAQDIYCGRSITEAITASSLLSCNLIIVSAGLGFVDSDSGIPAYSLTLSEGYADSLGPKISSATWRPSEWWSEVSKGHFGSRSLVDFMDANPNSIVLMALSTSYAKMISNEFEKLTLEQTSRIRIFGYSLLDILPNCVSGAVMPFDGRLDGPQSSKPGTMSDFSSRALSVFSEMVIEGVVSLKSADLDAATVSAHISEWAYPERLKRTKMSDIEILKVINEHWDDVDGLSSKMLTYLRRKLGIACEQSRFSKLFKEVKNTRDAKDKCYD